MENCNDVRLFGVAKVGPYVRMMADPKRCAPKNEEDTDKNAYEESSEFHCSEVLCMDGAATTWILLE